MKNALMKDTYREIKKSLGRFLSIFAISTLGVAIFAGIKVSSPDMKITADKYYDDYNFMDIRVLSTMGLTTKDIEDIGNIQGVDGILPTYSIDVLTNYKDVERVLKVHGLPIDKEESDKNYINKPKVIEGRLPEKNNECVIESSKFSGFTPPIGTKIKISSGRAEGIDKSLSINEYTVVGTVESPIYVAPEKGTTDIGNGKISGFIMIPQENFKMDIFTEAYVTVKGSKELQSYSKDYEEVISNVENKIKSIAKVATSRRYKDIVTEGNTKLNDSRKLYNENKNKVDNELAKAKSEIDTSRNKLTAGEAELNIQESDFNKTIDDAERKIASATAELDKGQVEYNNQLSNFNSNKDKIEGELAAAKEKLDILGSALEKFDKYYAEILQKLESENLTDEERIILEDIKSKIEVESEKYRTQYNDGLKAYEENKNKYENGKVQLTVAENKLKEGRATLENEKSKLAKAKEEGISGFSQGRSEIQRGREALVTAEGEYNKAKAEAEKKLAEAEKQIKDAEDKIKSIKEPEWFVLNRNTNYGFVDYGQSADRVDAIAQVFPVFFFLIAALVCLTTMTRMVDEQRINIGTLKALGYSKISIASKYILYALTASLSGSLVGLAIGFIIFPTVIFGAYSIMYSLPSVELRFNVPYALMSVLSTVFIITMAAIIACYKELIETPSLLMRPKAPKEGKRILLERIPFIWKRFGFIQKVTARNIFRYKKRFFMTVIGISGCTALLVSGFGIQDSIKAIVNKQFGEIYNYDMVVDIQSDLSEDKLNNLYTVLNDNSGISDFMNTSSNNVKISVGEKSQDITLVIPSETERLKEFIVLRSRGSKESIELSNNGIVITEKVAKLLDIKAGDKIYVNKENEDKKEVLVKGITEHYVAHYGYMSREEYRTLFGEEPEFKQIIGKVKDTSIEGEDKLSKELILEDDIQSVGFNSRIRDTFDDTIKSLSYVVLVMIIAAGALAFIVLYNLTNVNISERMREIATIKVLGFYDNEVSAYVYRENLILTFIGTLTGLILGIFLHRFIMVTAEPDMMMFGRNIATMSYIYAAILTMLFAVIVNAVMYFKLKNIHMVESLKSVD